MKDDNIDLCKGTLEIASKSHCSAYMYIMSSNIAQKNRPTLHVQELQKLSLLTCSLYRTSYEALAIKLLSWEKIMMA